jgi:hypothetical protein
MKVLWRLLLCYFSRQGASRPQDTWKQKAAPKLEPIRSGRENRDPRPSSSGPPAQVQVIVYRLYADGRVPDLASGRMQRNRRRHREIRTLVSPSPMAGRNSSCVWATRAAHSIEVSGQKRGKFPSSTGRWLRTERLQRRRLFARGRRVERRLALSMIAFDPETTNPPHARLSESPDQHAEPESACSCKLR